MSSLTLDPADVEAIAAVRYALSVDQVCAPTLLYCSVTLVAADERRRLAAEAVEFEVVRGLDDGASLAPPRT